MRKAAPPAAGPTSPAPATNATANRPLVPEMVAIPDPSAWITKESNCPPASAAATP